MKRIVMMMAAAVLMSTAAMAQGNNGQRPQFDRTEMIKQRTDQMVEKYKLNETQAAQLLELNTKNAETMGPGMGMRMGGGRGQGGRRGGGQGGPQMGGQGAPQMGGGGFQMTEEQRAQFEEMRKQREENQKKYDAELEKILTPEQFKSYQKDMEEQRAQR
ncbi:MAG: DUF4890 domain-containing protein, partial [Prevotella sp.]|nr:DUF4890 domain-containing protein [Prevotella sp.]